MLADTAVAAAPRVSKPPVLRTDSTLSQVSLDRATEQEAIVVDEGFCEVDDPNFGDAASRLACLELEDLESPSKASSSRSLKSEPLSSLPSHSSKSLRASSSRSLKATLSKSSGNSIRSGSSVRGSPLAASFERSVSIRDSDNLPPGSPFGQPEFQASEFAHTMSPEEAEARLNGIPGLPKQLLSGLMSLSPDELTVYMQLTEELKKEGINHQPASSPTAPRATPAAPSNGEEDERLENAVRKLKQLLPQSAIDQLQSHNSYGLMDIVSSQPLTPPPTPTSAAAEQ